MKKDYNSNRQLLSERLKTETPKTPIQEVRPVEATSPPKETPIKVEEAHVNFWAPSDLIKRVKMHSVTSGKSLKQISIEALEQYLAKNE